MSSLYLHLTYKVEIKLDLSRCFRPNQKIIWTFLSSWLFNLHWFWGRRRTLITFVVHFFLFHSTDCFNCPSPLGPSLRELLLECPQRSRNSLLIQSLSFWSFIIRTFLFHWQRMVAATQQVTSSNQPSGGSCGSTRLIKHSSWQIEVLWALAKWFGKGTDPFAKLSLETTHFKSIKEQLYTQGLADLEIIWSVIYRQVSQIFAQKMDPFQGSKASLFGEMNVSGNSVKCKKGIFGLLRVIYVWVWLAVFRSWALLLDGRLLSSGSDKVGTLPFHL